MRCSLSGQEISTVIGVASVMTTFSDSLKPELYSTARPTRLRASSLVIASHASVRHRHSADASRAALTLV
jgi:hypothetical protein